MAVVYFLQENASTTLVRTDVTVIQDIVGGIALLTLTIVNHHLANLVSKNNVFSRYEN